MTDDVRSFIAEQKQRLSPDPPETEIMKVATALALAPDGSKTLHLDNAISPETVSYFSKRGLRLAFDGIQAHEIDGNRCEFVYVMTFK